MADEGFKAYIQAEIRAIKAFQDSEAERLERKVTNNEAVIRWITTGLARKFRNDYEKRKSWATDMQNKKHSNHPKH